MRPVCEYSSPVLQRSPEPDFFYAVRCLHDNPSGQKIPLLLCSGAGAKRKRELFWGAVKKDDHSRHGGFITLKPCTALQPCSAMASRNLPSKELSKNNLYFQHVLRKE